MGISTYVCLEDFVSGYESAANTSMDEYVNALIENEVIRSNSQKNVEESITENDLAVSNSEGEIVPYSDGTKWYDNIGTTLPALPQQASYSKYNILNVVKKGDVLHESTGGVAALTGHIAIVEGTFWSETYAQWYIRTIESGVDGVVRGVLDDNRYSYRGVKVYYVTSASQTHINNAVTFCISQLGKPYNWGGITSIGGALNRTSSAATWYCSELVWAAYYNQGINLNGSTLPTNVYLPSELASSSKLTRRTVSAY